MHEVHPASLAIIGKHARYAIAVLEQFQDRCLHQEVDALMDAVILQRADHLQPGPIAHVCQSRVLVTAEVPLQDAAFPGAVEDRAPCLEFPHAVGRLLRVDLGHAPIVQILPAAHRVGEVHTPVVAVVDIAHGRRHATLGHDGVRLAKQRLAQNGDGRAFGRSLDRRSQPRAARADDQYIAFPCLPRHVRKSSSRSRCPWRTSECRSR